MANDLKHVGILGMKWGRRKARSASPDTSSGDHKTSSKLKKKKLSEMSNEELKTLTTRLQLERQYKDLTKADTSAGRKFISEVITGAGKQLASKYVANAGESVIKTIIELTKKTG
jgi:hypothetical protein